MPLVKAADAPVFDNDHATFVGLAAPSRGSGENSAWRVILKPGAAGPPHALSREEIFVALSGRAVVTMDGDTLDLGPGDALIVPAETLFTLANPGPDPFEAVAILPVGGLGLLAGQEPFTPPWAA
ncbi:cupin domain-containing protein [Embleya sp. NPDC055664]|uniref:cupin domain-containing protein n=1 Tax=Embleya sp. NPDC059237 TaxID=3346784 RepID=UPI003686D5AD